MLTFVIAIYWHYRKKDNMQYKLGIRKRNNPPTLDLDWDDTDGESEASALWQNRRRVARV
jgi:hypothetical protein